VISMRYSKYRYRAWALDRDGNSVLGVEEEIRARTDSEACRVAWGHAGSILREDDPDCAVSLEYVERIENDEKTG